MTAMREVTKRRLTYDISGVAPYINWAYFFHAWQVRDRAEQERLRLEAGRILDGLEGRYRVHALLALGDAGSDGDDILFGSYRIPMLRQQRPSAGGVCLSLSDYVRPLSAGRKDRLGVFATTVDIGLETDFASDDYMRMMVQLLADRLAEAAAERLHKEVRTVYWGYAPYESLSMAELHAGKFCGIRPAVGYPSMPDTSLNFVLDDILGFSDIGIRLTENGAMKPHASVSGLMMGHPSARYFVLGRIGEDLLRDYASRRGVAEAVLRRFLISNMEL